MIFLENIAIDRVAFRIGQFDVYWYGIAYFATFILSLILAKRIIKYQKPQSLTKKNLDTLLNYIVLGVVLGGRIGEFLFYKPTIFTKEIFFIRSGGMSFHGGVLGVVIAILLFSWRLKKDKFQVSDIIAICVPIGSFLGRLANFVNDEIIGRTTSIFLPYLTKHPVVFYEAFFEGLVLFFLLYRKKNLAKTGYTTSMFLFFYGLFRFVLEFFRLPDGMFYNITTAQFLSVLMMVSGVLIYCIQKPHWKR